MAPKRNCKFLMKWLEDKKYRRWLTYAKSSKVAKCQLCMSTIDVRTMGKAALDCHMKGKKHKDLVKEPSNLLSWVQPSNTSGTVTADLSSCHQQHTSSSCHFLQAFNHFQHHIS